MLNRFLLSMLLVVLSLMPVVEAETELPALLHGQLGREATVVAFIGVSCPVANRYIPLLNELHDEFALKGVRFVGMNSNPGESALETAEHALKFEIGFEVYKDIGHRAADYFQATRTPEVFVMDGEGKLRYRGRIDDQHRPGSSAAQTTRSDLYNAIDAVVNGCGIEEPVTEAVGCVLTRDYDNQPELTFTRDIQPIIQDKCLACHRPDAVAGFFSWTSYEQVRGMAGMIKQVVTDKRMPPWHADPQYGEFANDRSLSDEQRDAIIAWIDTGAPKGDPADAPAPREFPEDAWTIGEPDQIIKLPEPYPVPASGVIDYQYFVVDIGHEEDLWVERVEAIPDSPAVHHIILFAISPDKENRNRIMLGGSAPGDLATVLPYGFAKKIPKGYKLLFEMHYTPIGREVTDQSYVGLVFSDHPDPTQVHTHPLAYHDFKIAANDPDFTQESVFAVNADIKALTFMPHMHVRGKSWRYELECPEGEMLTLLNVPEYDFNWQSVYRLKEPLEIKAGSKLHMTAVWDNSEENPYNPDPNRVVTYGEQTWDEMMFGFMDFYVTEKPKGRLIERVYP